MENTSNLIPLDLPRQYNATTHFIDRHLQEGRGDKIALIDKEGSYSYRELAERVNRAGNVLRGLGVRMETRVVLCLVDTVEFVAAFWGAIKIGAVPIPINTLLTTQDYEYILPDSRAELLLVSDVLYSKVAPLLKTEAFLKTTVVAGKESHGQPLFSNLLKEASPRLEAAPTTPDDVAFWLYSSGSTGAPKGVIHLQSHLVGTAETYGRHVLKIQENDVVYSAAKLFFAYGLGNSMTFPFHVGATTILMDERPTPNGVLALMKQYQPTIFYGVPTLYNAILADESNNRACGSAKMQTCISAGEALPKEIAQSWKKRFGTEILDGIGSTEMLHIFLSNRKGEICDNSTGKAVMGYELKIVDEEDHEVPLGEIGELLVKGPTSALGYWNQRQKSLHTFQGPWTRTGDKYTLDEQGYYHYEGRTDDMLKISGIWVSPFEVEAVLITHPAVLEAAVVGKVDENDLIKPQAFLVLKETAQASDALSAELKQFVKDRLAPYKYPRWIQFINELPKTATGKIQRFKLRA